MACDEPARTRHPALGAAAVERTRACRRRGGRLVKVSVFVEAPHFVVAGTRRGVAATLRGVPRRPHGVRRRRGPCGGPFGVRPFHQHVVGARPGPRATRELRDVLRGPAETSSGARKLVSNAPHALGRGEALRLDRRASGPPAACRQRMCWTAATVEPRSP